MIKKFEIHIITNCEEPTGETCTNFSACSIKESDVFLALKLNIMDRCNLISSLEVKEITKE